MSFFGSTEFFLEVSKGNIANHKALIIQGHNADIDSGANEDVWGQGGELTLLISAETMNIVSTSTDDGSPTGTGARTIIVTGLNGSHVLTTETVTMNGTTNVLTSNSYIHIRSLMTLAVGSTRSNVGNITATSSSSATVQCFIEATNGESHNSHYSIPANTTGFLTHMQFWGSRTSGGMAPIVEYQLHYDRGEGERTVIHAPLDGAVEVSQVISVNLPLEFVAESDMHLEIDTDQNNTDVHSQMYVIEVT